MQEVVSFETALKLKKLGFSYIEDTMSKSFYEPNYMWYVNHRTEGYITVGSFAIDCTPEGHAQYLITEETPLIPAPTIYDLQAVFREKHGIHIKVDPDLEGGWTYKTESVISEKDGPAFRGEKSSEDIIPHEGIVGGTFSTYELALEAAEYELLEQM